MKRWRMFGTLLPLLAAAYAGIGGASHIASAAGTTWYVWLGGNGDCTSAFTPCGSIATAIGKASAGDAISIGPGTFHESFHVPKSLALAGSGEGATVLQPGSAPEVMDVDAGVSTLTGVTISGATAAQRSAISVAGGASLTLTSVTVSGNTAVGRGGGITNAGRLTVIGSSFSDNQAVGGADGSAAGGAIFNNGGTLTVEDSVFLGNTVTGARGAFGDQGADGSYGGDGSDSSTVGGIADAGGNGGDGGQGASGGNGGAALGGAIASVNVPSSTHVTILRSSFLVNRANGGEGGQGGPGGGGGNGGKGGEGKSGSTLGGHGGDAGNGGPGGTGGFGGVASGGALYSDSGELDVSASSFHLDSAIGGTGGHGGNGGGGGTGGDGGKSDGCPLNPARGYPWTRGADAGNGGNGGSGQLGSTGGAADGGGIAVAGGTGVVSNSTFSNNQAKAGDMGYPGSVGGAGPGGSGGYVYFACGDSGHSGSDGSNGQTDLWPGSQGGSAQGGALSNAGSAVSVLNSTVADNGASGGAWNGGSCSNCPTLAYDGFGLGGNLAGPSLISLSNTIVVDSTSGDNCSTGVTDVSHNLQWPAGDTSCGASMRVGDPKLSPFRFNGGTTKTMEPQPGSAAIDAGDDAICAAPPVSHLDQRGSTRPAGPHCDIGAVEAGPVTTTSTVGPSSLAFGSQFIGADSTRPVTLSNTGGAPLTVSSIQTTGSDFSQTTTCGSSVPAGTSCTISVSFHPTSAGPHTGTLTILDSSRSSPHRIPLSGAGAQPHLPGSTIARAVSTRSYTLSGSDPNTWKDMDATTLVLHLAPAADESAVLSGNATLWSSAGGSGEQLAISISGGTYGTGKVVTWQWSGNQAAHSPSAVVTHGVVSLQKRMAYTIKLQWKPASASSGTIGTGPGATWLTAEILPPGSGIMASTASSGDTYYLPLGAGQDWGSIDSSKLVLHVTPTFDSTAILFASAALVNASDANSTRPDLGIAVSSPTRGTSVVAWEESNAQGAGAVSPVSVHGVIPLKAGTAYTITLEWKEAVPTNFFNSAIRTSPDLSPTQLMAEVIPTVSPTSVFAAGSAQQYSLNGSDGKAWQAVDASRLVLHVTPAADSTALLSGAADLFSTAAGTNQDLGIAVSTTGSNAPVIWEENGGLTANTSSVLGAIPLKKGLHYTIKLVWKANRQDSGGIGAQGGQGSGTPTWLDAVLTPS